MRILIADDDRTSRNLLKVVLSRLGYTVHAEADGDAAWQVLQQPDAPQLVILDWMMPGMEGIEICTRLRQVSTPEAAYTYVILLTAKGSKKNIIRGMEAGADDYVVKPFDQNELRVRLRAGQRIVELHRELLVVKRELFEQSITDPLTGVLNRRALLSQLEHEYDRAERTGVPFGLSMLDVDHFKAVNDTHGHTVGDAVLKEIVRRIREAIRPYDAVGRFGGEEFLIVLPGAGRSEIISISERIRKKICSTKIRLRSLAISVSASQGVIAWDGRTDIHGMIRLADEALYQAKAAGRNGVKTAHVASVAVS